MDGKTRFVAAMELFKTSRRFDMPVRMAYVRAYIDNDIPALIRAEQAYLEMIRASCEFYMHVPRLRSPEDFVVTFRSFVMALRQHGFGDADIFYRDPSGEVVNGQHCVAIAAVLGIDVRVKETELAAKRMSYMRFRRCHVPRAVAYYAIRQYMRFNDGARVVPWWRKLPKGAVV